MPSDFCRPAGPASVTAPAPPDGAAPASDLHHPALIALVRLLARQAVRDWLAQPETAEDEDHTDALSISSAVSADERR